MANLAGGSKEIFNLTLKPCFVKLAGKAVNKRLQNGVE